MRLVLRMALLVLACGLVPSLAGAAQDQAKLRLDLIGLVEDRLSAAYTFGPREGVPDFATLDEIYPTWDGGQPGDARRAWLDKGLTAQKVTYRVDNVFLTSDYTARVRGHKTLTTEKEESMLVWFSHQAQDQATSRFTMDAYRDLDGQWRLRQIFEY